jgi:hypothetical protein
MKRRIATLTEVFGYIVIIAVTFAVAVAVIEAAETIYNVFFILTGD